MSIWFLLTLFLASTLIALCYWGAGIVLYPPKMSQLEIFPEQFGLRYEKVSFKTSDGVTLRGWFIRGENSQGRTLLMCHGWGDNKGELLGLTHFLAADFDLFYFDNRSHGESEGHFCTLGFHELKDFDAAMDFLRARKPECLARLGVFGLSMGAAIACVAVPQHPEIKAAVLESPFTDYRQVVRQYTWNHFKLPHFPFVWLTLWMLRLRVGDPNVDDYRPIQHVAQIAPRPILVIGGSADDLMREADVRALYAAASQPKQLWIVPDAGHAECHEIAGLEYETRVANFLNKHL
ncbi:MAG: alpha/beta fold hydrolase [Elusimicrobia bacterium]|nr:alpha/beta fold hydrolase [Elusimicrobiota bacterium]